MARIMIVDDSCMVRDLLNQSLSEHHHEVLGVAPVSLQAVLSAGRSFRPRLVITDFHMPDCPGEELVRAIRADPALGATPILVFTAHRDPDAFKDMIRMGIHGLVFKGISLHEVMNRVGEILV